MSLKRPMKGVLCYSGSQRIEERELEPWDSTTGVNGSENITLEMDGANGWDANDMFRKNEQIYGVQSTYDHTLSAYTVPLQSSDSADYRYVSYNSLVTILLLRIAKRFYILLKTVAVGQSQLTFL